jgi:hypothetical protein
MELTNEIIETYGFKRINNSMFKQGELTLQSKYIHEGNSIYEKMLNTKKAYKVCFKGKFIAMVENERQLIHIVQITSLKQSIIRNYTTFDLIRFNRLANENKSLKPIELIKLYNKKYPEKTAKEKLLNLSKALGINHLTT